MELLYAAYVPPGEGPFPTVLMLHGWGASAHDLFSLAPFMHGGGALVLCPQGPVSFEIAQGVPGFGWWPITPGREPEGAAFDEARRLLRAFFDAACQRYPVDRRKVVVLGFSQGGVMAFDLALSAPEQFAGLVALSSWLPDSLANALSRSPAHENFPALLIHGARDDLIPVALAQEARQKLMALGLNVSYREFEMQHEVSQEALLEVVRWTEGKIFNLIQLA